MSAARVLVLNASYEPIRVVGWQAAFVLWFQDKADIVESHSYQIRSSRQNFNLPSVLRLKKYIKPWKKNYAKFSRDNVFFRDDYKCQYCAKTFSKSMLTFDHVIPHSRGGAKSWTNIVTACKACNHKKANKTPKEANMPLLKKPRPLKQSVISPVDRANKDVYPEQWRPYIF